MLHARSSILESLRFALRRWDSAKRDDRCEQLNKMTAGAAGEEVENRTQAAKAGHGAKCLQLARKSDVDEGPTSSHHTRKARKHLHLNFVSG